MAADVKFRNNQGAYQYWLSLLTLIFLPFLVVMLVNTAQFRGLRAETSLEQAVTARHVAGGKGFTTSVIRPRSLVFNESFTEHPDLTNGPLSVIPSALAIKLGQERQGKSIVLATCFCWLLTVWVLWVVGGALFGSDVGRYAALLMCFSPASLAFAVNADGRIWATPLLLLLWLMLGRGVRTPAAAAVCGLLMGLCMLTDYGLVLPLLLAVIPAMVLRDRDAAPEGEPAESPEPDDDDEAVVVEPVRRRLDLKPGLIALGVLAVVCLPWLGRNLKVAGTPFPGLSTYQIISNTDHRPGRSIERRLAPQDDSLSTYFRNFTRDMIAKGMAGLLGLRDGFGTTTEWPLTGLFLASLFLPAAGAMARARMALALAMLWDGLLTAFVTQNFGHLVIWVPLTAMYASWFVVERLAIWITEPAKRWFVTWSPTARRKLAGAAVIAIVGAPGLYPQMFTPAWPEREASEANYSFLQQAVPEGQAIITDDPWTTAYHVDRPCIWLPQTDDDLQAVEKLHPGEIGAVYFSMRSGQKFRWTKVKQDNSVVNELGDWWLYAQAMPQGYRNFGRIGSKTEGEVVLLRVPERPQPVAE